MRKSLCHMIFCYFVQVWISFVLLCDRIIRILQRYVTPILFSWHRAFELTGPLPESKVNIYTKFEVYACGNLAGGYESGCSAITCCALVL